MLKKILGFLWLEGMWLILWQSTSALTIVGGILSIILISLLFTSPTVDLDITIKPLLIIKILILFFLYLVQSSLMVAWYAIRPKKPPSSDVFLVESAIDSELVSVLLYDFIILIPGTIIVEIEHKKPVIHVHNLDATNPKAFYRQYYDIEKLFHRAFLSHYPYQRSSLDTHPRSVKQSVRDDVS